MSLMHVLTLWGFVQAPKSLKCYKSSERKAGFKHLAEISDKGSGKWYTVANVIQRISLMFGTRLKQNYAYNAHFGSTATGARNFVLLATYMGWDCHKHFTFKRAWGVIQKRHQLWLNSGSRFGRPWTNFEAHGSNLCMARPWSGVSPSLHDSSTHTIPHCEGR